MSEVQSTLRKGLGAQKNRSLSECFAFLDAVNPIAYDQTVSKRMQALNIVLQNPAKDLDIITFGGSSSKDVTISFATKLLQEEKLKVGVFYASNILSYSEQININDEPVANKVLAEALNTVIDVSLKSNIQATAFEILLQAGMLIFAKEAVDACLLEVGVGGRYDATAFYAPKICAITKVAPKHIDLLGNDLDQVACEMLAIAKPGSWVISAEQSKLRLQKMKVFAEQNGFLWSMPIRKLSPLPYIYEQLFGKEASLAERVVQIYIENIKGRFSPFLRGNLLATQKGQRGRPTLETKRNSELNPLQTVKSFWAQNFKLNPGIFEILEQEKPTILLDKAEDLESLGYTFLGLRLLHYKKPIVGLCIIMGLAKEVDAEEMLKLSRYLFKKIPGEIYFVPLVDGDKSHNPEELSMKAKQLNVRAVAFQNVKEAFEHAKKVVDERDGIVCLSGNIEVINNYWRQVREIKKLQL